MRYKIYLTIALVGAIAVGVTVLCNAPTKWILALCAIVFITTVLAWRAVAKPLGAMRNGMDLLRSQDFSSRLRKTGQQDADRVIELFNRLMGTMKAERLKLEEQNLFLAKLMAVSPMGVAICDLDDNIVETNPVFRKMQTAELDREIKSLAPEEVKIVRQGSAEIYRCSRLWFMDSGFRRTFYIIERLTDDIVESERDVFRKVVRTIGHEVNNTLAPVVSVMESIAEMQPADSIAATAIDSAIDSCHGLQRFVSDYASVVKLPKPNIQPVDATEELRRMRPTLQALIGNNIVIDVDNDSATAPLNIDMVLIERAITNIVKNAAESIGSRPGGHISISLHDNTLSITDNGAGISEQTARRLFTPFFSTKHPDRGLGLMLVADILRAHGAQFSLYTSPESGLTTFTIIFPTANA